MKDIKIEYDDNVITIIERINERLIEHDLILLSDGEYHDGYEIFSLERKINEKI